jgi:hypothetical protein
MKRAFLLILMIIGNRLLNHTTAPGEAGFSPGVFTGVVVLYVAAIILALREIRNAL